VSSRHIYNYIERLGELLEADLRLNLADAGLLPAQFQVLHYLSMCNRFSDTPIAIAEFLGQTKGSISQTVKVLQQKGMLSRQPDVSDKRISHLVLTATAQQVLSRNMPPVKFDKASQNLSRQQQFDIISALKLLHAAVVQTNQLKTFGVCRSCRYLAFSETKISCEKFNSQLTVRDTQLICRAHEP